MRLVDKGVRPGDICVAFTPDEFAQALVDAAVKKGLIPEDRRLDPALHEYVKGDHGTPHWLTVVPPGTQLHRGVLDKRQEPQ